MGIKHIMQIRKNLQNLNEKCEKEWKIFSKSDYNNNSHAQASYDRMCNNLSQLTSEIVECYEESDKEREAAMGKKAVRPYICATSNAMFGQLIHKRYTTILMETYKDLLEGNEGRTVDSSTIQEIWDDYDW